MRRERTRNRLAYFNIYQTTVGMTERKRETVTASTHLHTNTHTHRFTHTHRYRQYIHLRLSLASLNYYEILALLLLLLLLQFISTCQCRFHSEYSSTQCCPPSPLLPPPFPLPMLLLCTAIVTALVSMKVYDTFLLSPLSLLLFLLCHSSLFMLLGQFFIVFESEFIISLVNFL